MKPICNFGITPAITTRRLLIIFVAVVMAGCATPIRPPETTSPILVPQSTWVQVDYEIGAASLTAAGPAKGFARRQMEHWRDLVAQRTEANFIPWFSSYWTQQWLSTKVAWYQLSQEDVSSRLANYLQDQYRDQVLLPVAKEIDPETVRAQAIKLYILRFRDELRLIQHRHALPPDQFERRLRAISAIELGPPPANNASLYQLIYTKKIDGLPAYVALLRQAHKTPGGASRKSKERISPVAERVSKQLLDRLAITGGSSAVSALIGGIAGTVISLGAAGIGIVLHESNRAETEAQLRQSLGLALSDSWQSLMDDPATGVMSGINSLSDQIEKCCPQTYAQPVELNELPPEGAIPDDNMPRDQINSSKLLDDDDELGQFIKGIPGNDEMPNE